MHVDHAVALAAEAVAEAEIRALGGAHEPGEGFDLLHRQARDGRGPGRIAGAQVEDTDAQGATRQQRGERIEGALDEARLGRDRAELDGERLQRGELGLDGGRRERHRTPPWPSSFTD